MEPKKNEKGKLVPFKGRAIPKLFELKDEKQIRILMEWYQTKFKPHACHFYECVNEAIKLEAESGKGPADKIKKEMIDSNAEKIISVIMDNLHACFDAFNFHLKKGNEQSSLAAGTQYATTQSFSVMDIMLFNEIFQILHMYEGFVNQSNT